MKKRMLVGALLLLCMLRVAAGQKLDLKAITDGEFRAETLAAVEPLLSVLSRLDAPDGARRDTTAVC